MSVPSFILYVFLWKVFVPRAAATPPGCRARTRCRPLLSRFVGRCFFLSVILRPSPPFLVAFFYFLVFRFKTSADRAKTCFSSLPVFFSFNFRTSVFTALRFGRHVSGSRSVTRLCRGYGN
uniref:Secreted protein n=1 Tax=Ixodes ricinus TaxID=34613 RepID=A0A6B0UP40_IXORI